MESEISAICVNRVSAFFVSDNARLVSTNSFTYEDVSEDDCLKMCSENRDNKGRSILCASFTYDHAIFTCSISRSKSTPDGELDTESATGKRYFEKFCIDEDLPVECADTQFLRADQSVIIGYAKNVSIVESLEECAAQCLKERFPCKSAMYFYEEGECITNTESALSKPSSFAREESDKVIYFQNGCNIVLEKQKLFDTATDTESSAESSDAAMQATTEIVETTAVVADRVILSEAEHRNAEEAVEEVEKRLDLAEVEKSEDKQGHEEVEKVQGSKEKTNVKISAKEKSKGVKITGRKKTGKEREMNRKEKAEDEEEKIGKEKTREVEVSGREKEVFATESTTETSEITMAQESVKDSQEEETGSKNKLKSKKTVLKSGIRNGKKDRKKEEKQEKTEDSDSKKAKKSSARGGCGDEDGQHFAENVQENEITKKFSNHPRTLVRNDDKRKKNSHKKLTNNTLRRRSHASKMAHKKSMKIVQVDPATILAEQQRGELDMNEITFERKAKARGVKSSKKLNIKTIANTDELLASLLQEASGYFSLWSEWTPCLSSGERKVRRRKCLDLRKCVGALMEVDKCPEDVSMEHDSLSQVRAIVSAGPMGPEMSIPIRNSHAAKQALPPSIMPSHLPAKKKTFPHSTAIHNVFEDIWSPWLGVCQEFASGQPCKNHEVIGFESRECIAKDPAKCVGPFFRYCTLPC
ncbi:unnamed protein product [Toxocara canis]|uniref:PAN domain protein n=1 Tax=Toxocara canis TaxID=6265 RepID=A0A183UMU0_TOXCA|nr:unnamed protein product [Toxocara canis]